MRSSLFWSIAGKFASQISGFVFAIILARILLPEHFGIIAMIMAIVNVSQVFLDLGIGTALIQKKEVSQKLYDSVFTINMLIGVFLAILVYLNAPLIGQFYDNRELVIITKVMSITFFIDSLGVVPTIVLTKKMNFKAIVLVSIISIMVAGVIAIGLAIFDFGIWALVVQIIVSKLVTTLGVFLTSKWRYRFSFSRNELKQVWSFGLKMFFDSGLTVILNQADNIIIGKLFKETTLGYYYRSKNINQVAVDTTSQSISKVMFPAISLIQDDIKQIRVIYSTYFARISVLSIFIACWLYLVSSELITLLYGVKWIESIPYFKILIIGSVFVPLNSMSLNVLLGMGKVNDRLRLAIVRKILRAFSLAVAVWFGIDLFLKSRVLQTAIIFVLAMLVVYKRLQLKGIKEILFFLKLMVVTWVAVLSLDYFIVAESQTIMLVIKSLGFFAVYIFIVYILGFPLKQELSNLYQIFKTKWSGNGKSQ